MPQTTMLLAGLPHTGQMSDRCSCSKGIQRLESPACSFMASSQATSPHNMVLITPVFYSTMDLTSSNVVAV